MTSDEEMEMHIEHTMLVGRQVQQEAGERCPSWHDWSYDEKSGLTWCREHGRVVPEDEVDEAWESGSGRGRV